MNLYKKAYSDYMKLSEELSQKRCSLQELCKELDGHNLTDDEYFDLNYGCLCVTIYKEKEMFYIQECFEIWDDINLRIFVECARISDVIEQMNAGE